LADNDKSRSCQPGKISPSNQLLNFACYDFIHSSLAISSVQNFLLQSLVHFLSICTPVCPEKPVKSEKTKSVATKLSLVYNVAAEPGGLSLDGAVGVLANHTTFCIKCLEITPGA
jgi:hypothetical protein